jgi:DNA polymerase/3'-5' exonuclease PolX
MVDSKADLFATSLVPSTDAALNSLIDDGILAKRKNVKGSEMWGEKNKLAVHVRTGVPVDFFATTESAWWNYVVCRTGPGESNIAIEVAAQRKGWKWNPYGEGFTDGGKVIPVRSEREAFELVGLPYKEPKDR